MLRGELAVVLVSLGLHHGDDGDDCQVDDDDHCDEVKYGLVVGDIVIFSFTSVATVTLCLLLSCY